MRERKEVKVERGEDEYVRERDRGQREVWKGSEDCKGQKTQKVRREIGSKERDKKGVYIVKGKRH